VRVITPPSRWAPLRLREVWEFRDLFRRFVARDLTLRYRQTALGVIWVVLQPLLGAGVLSFVFGRIARLPSDGVPYFVFAYVGMLAWNTLSSTVTKISTSLTGNQQLISKIFFPRLVLPLSTLGSTLIDFLVALVMLAVILLVQGVAPGVTLLTLPIWLFLLVLLGSGIGLTAAALMVSYRDIGYVLPVVLQVGLYASPVAYSMAAVPTSVRWAVTLNPMTGLLEGFRSACLGFPLPAPGLLAWSACCSVSAFLGGALVFANRERRFADVI
jgi:lipopolysaccharide transport system permease protein